MPFDLYFFVTPNVMVACMGLSTLDSMRWSVNLNLGRSHFPHALSELVCVSYSPSK